MEIRRKHGNDSMQHEKRLDRCRGETPKYIAYFISSHQCLDVDGWATIKESFLEKELLQHPKLFSRGTSPSRSVCVCECCVLSEKQCLEPVVCHQ